MPQETATRPRIETASILKRVRARVGGTYVADSRQAKLVIAGPRPITYAVPVEDLRPEVIGRKGEARDHPLFGRIRDAHIQVGDRRVEAGLRFFEVPPSSADGSLEDHVAIKWDAPDAWYEEEDQVWVHPRDPHHRIDVRQGNHHVVVEVDGDKIAETHSPMLLFEPGLPVRYYLPPPDVRHDVLRESDTRTGCPYKGFARYHDVHAGGRWHEDLAWTYRTSFADALRVQGMIAFFNERVDLIVDGAPQEQPSTTWSRSVREAVERAARSWE